MAAIATLTLNPAVDLATSTARLERSHKLRCAAPQVHPGGGGINVARVLHRLGADVLALCTAGGCTGQRLQQLLAAEGVPVQAIPVAADTRESFHVVETGTGAEFRFVLPGPTLQPAEWQACLGAVQALAPRPAWLVLSGSLPPGVPDDAYAQLARAARQAGMQVAVDASGPALAAALQAGVDLCKPSLRELRDVTGQALPDLASQRAAAQALMASGQAQRVALSLGEDGALLVAPQGTLHSRALPVPVASTSGAGDSFLAGLLLDLARGAGDRDAFATAMAAGAAALLAPGTALCSPADLARLRGQVQVEAMA